MEFSPSYNLRENTNNTVSESYKEQEERIWEQEELINRFEILPDEEALEILAERNFNEAKKNYYLNFKQEAYDEKIDWPESIASPKEQITRKEKLFLIRSSRYSKRNRIPLGGSDINIDSKTGIILIPCWQREKSPDGTKKEPKLVPYYFVLLDLHKAIRMQDHILADRYGLILNNPNPGQTEIKRLLKINRMLEEIKEKFWQLGKTAETTQESEDKIKLLNEINDLTNEVRTMLSEKGYTNLLRDEFKKEIEETLNKFNYDLNIFLDSKNRYNPPSKALKTYRLINLAQKRIKALTDKIAPKIIARKQALITMKVIQDEKKDRFIELLSRQLEEEVMPLLRTIYQPEEGQDQFKINFDDQEAKSIWLEEADNKLVAQKEINEKKLSELIKTIDGFFAYRVIPGKRIRNVAALGAELNIVPYSQFRKEILTHLDLAKKELRKKDINEVNKHIRNVYKLLEIFKNLDKVFGKEEKI